MEKKLCFPAKMAVEAIQGHEIAPTFR